ncbi:MAG TPA: hypothetical protein VJU82_05240 [Acidobacteriaceae bacterium]|nr:hypothetical protein [Acidobacteriaceae bacterium]
MSLHEALFAVNQFVFDAVGLAARLDSVSGNDDPMVIAEIVRNGRLEYEALMHKAAVRSALADAAVVRAALDNIQARLKLLELTCRKGAVAANDARAVRTNNTKEAR